MKDRFKLFDFDDMLKHGLLEESDRVNIEPRLYVVEHVSKGQIRVLGYDYGEPEDQSLYKDWSWIIPALNEAYKAGMKEGKKL